MTLVIGDKTLSSWSMRPWLLMKYFRVPFEEVLIRLDRPETHASILKYSPSGKVPALIDGDLVVWESLAIMEYLHDKFPEKKMYPLDLKTRAYARSLAHEMHAGFLKMRQHMSFSATKTFKNFDCSPAIDDINRVKNLWSESLKQSGGPFLMGEFTIVDAMYAPVVGRFATYGVALTGALHNYSREVMEQPMVRQWYSEALAE